jgi:hypothetical protein
MKPYLERPHVTVEPDVEDTPDGSGAAGAMASSATLNPIVRRLRCGVVMVALDREAGGCENPGELAANVAIGEVDGPQSARL